MNPTFLPQPISVAHTLSVCRWTLAGCWLYQGMIPKLLGPHPQEMVMAFALGLSERAAWYCTMAAGTAEVSMAIWMACSRRSERPFLITLVAMMVLLLYAAWSYPDALGATFNPVMLNTAFAVVAYIGWRHAVLSRDGGAAQT